MSRTSSSRLRGAGLQACNCAGLEGLQRCIEAVDRIVTDLEALAAMTTQRG
jgi:hypothetical protein